MAVSLQISVTNFVNFAYGEFLTFGAYVAWEANSRGVNFSVAIAVACVATGVLSVLANVIVFRPLVRRRVRPVTIMVSGLGLALLAQNGIALIWGVQPHSYQNTGLNQNSLQIGPFLMTPVDLGLTAMAGGLLLLLHLGLQYTKFGKSLRATSNNTDLAQACGVNVDRVVSITWFIAGVLTAVAGVALVLEETTLVPTTGFNVLFLVFGAVILGGIGRPYGAMIGALIVGLLTEISGAYISGGYKSSIAFVIVIAMLLFRPQGLIATRGKTS